MTILGGEITLEINEIADAYSGAVPARIIAEKLLVEQTDIVAIETERVLFRKFIVDTYEKDHLEFSSQGVAWEAYTWDLDEWIGIDDSDIPDEPPFGEGVWLNEIRNALEGQIDPSNYDENGGQQ